MFLATVIACAFYQLNVTNVSTAPITPWVRVFAGTIPLSQLMIRSGKNPKLLSGIKYHILLQHFYIIQKKNFCLIIQTLYIESEMMEPFHVTTFERLGIKRPLP